MLHYPIRSAVLLLWTTIACQAAVIPPPPPQLPPQQELTEPSPPLLDHQQHDQQSSQENAAFLNYNNNNNYYNNDPPTTTTNLMAAEPPSDDVVMQNDFAVPPPPIVNIKVPDAGSQQDSLAYDNNQHVDSLMDHHAINNNNEDEMLDNSSLSTMDDEEDDDDNELYDDEEEDDLMTTNDEEGYLFNVPDHNENMMESEELVVDPSTGMPAFRNKNDNDFNVMNQPNAPQSPPVNDLGINVPPPPSPPPADQKPLPATDASTSTTPLHQRSSFFGDWRLLLAALALLAVWKLITGKPRLMGASTRVTQTCMIFLKKGCYLLLPLQLSIAETVGPHLERRKQLIQKYELAAAARRIPVSKKKDKEKRVVFSHEMMLISLVFGM